MKIQVIVTEGNSAEISRLVTLAGYLFNNGHEAYIATPNLDKRDTLWPHTYAPAGSVEYEGKILLRENLDVIIGMVDDSFLQELKDYPAKLKLLLVDKDPRSRTGNSNLKDPSWTKISSSFSMVQYLKREYDVDCKYIGLGLDDYVGVLQGRFVAQIRPNDRGKVVCLRYDNESKKGFLEGVQVCRNLHRAGLIEHVYIVGQRNNQIGKIGRFSNTYHDETDAELLQEIYSRCAVMVWPSRVETLSMSPIEAMLCGCSVAAYDLEVNRDFINEDTALLCRSGDSVALEANTRRLLNRPEKRCGYFANFLELTRDMTWNRVISNLEMIFKEMTNERMEKSA